MQIMQVIDTFNGELERAEMMPFYRWLSDDLDDGDEEDVDEVDDSPKTKLPRTTSTNQQHMRSSSNPDGGLAGAMMPGVQGGGAHCDTPMPPADDDRTPMPAHVSASMSSLITLKAHDPPIRQASTNNEM